GEQQSPRAVRRRLPGRVGEPREPRDVVNAEVGAVEGDEQRAELVEARLVALTDLGLSQHDAYALSVLELADGIDASFVSPQAARGLLGRRGFRDQVTDRRIPPGKIDARLLADEAATAVAPDEVLRAERAVLA